MPPSPQVMVNSMYWTPQGPNCNGKSFETKTILGRVLRPSSVPNSPHKPSVSTSYTVSRNRPSVSTS